MRICTRVGRDGDDGQVQQVLVWIHGCEQQRTSPRLLAKMLILSWRQWIRSSWDAFIEKARMDTVTGVNCRRTHHFTLLLSERMTLNATILPTSRFGWTADRQWDAWFVSGGCWWLEFCPIGNWYLTMYSIARCASESWWAHISCH